MGKNSSIQEIGQKQWSTLDKSLNAEERNKLRLEIKLQFNNEIPRKELQEKYNISRAQLHRISKEETAPKSKGKKAHLNEEQRTSLLEKYLQEHYLSYSDFQEEKKPKRFFEFLISKISTSTWKPSTNFLYPEFKKFKDLSAKLQPLNQNYTISNTQSESNLIQNNTNNQNNTLTNENNTFNNENDIFNNVDTMNNFNNGNIFSSICPINEAKMVQHLSQGESFFREQQYPFSTAISDYHDDLQQSAVSILPTSFQDSYFDEASYPQEFQFQRHHQREFLLQNESNQAQIVDNPNDIFKEDYPQFIFQSHNETSSHPNLEEVESSIDYLFNNISGEYQQQQQGIID